MESEFKLTCSKGKRTINPPLVTLTYEQPLVPQPQDYREDFFMDVADALVGVGLICNRNSTTGVVAR
ncbi:protein strawberry notch-like [Leptopilina heterotoma]|uniref:protein strawberry notch-like n=1 Tax=Leptopilina heterotoma TaxID=63436 RepID=UPI001CAA2E7E|nr:protein strawberry notch-like [Leptopilina heterotoma]